MAETEVSSLREALCNQQMTMARLYMDLEEERKASASAADEALTMILRLQQEKASEKMEASQYRRMAEERLNYAEESLEFLQEILQQKDVEIEFLRCQIQTHNNSFYDTGAANPPIKRSNTLHDKRRPGFLAKRNFSLSAVQFEKLRSGIEIFDDGNSVYVEDFEKSHIINRCKVEEFNSDTDHAEELKAKSKMLLRSASAVGKMASASAKVKFQRTATIHSLDSTDSGFFSSFKAADGLGASDLEAESESVCRKNRTNPQDNFEVSKCLDDFSSIAESHNQISSEYNLKTEQFTNDRVSLSSQVEIELMKERLQSLEDESETRKLNESVKNKEQFILLQEIHEKLDSIQFHLKSISIEKPNRQDDHKFVSLMEAMLHFSI